MHTFLHLALLTSLFQSHGGAEPSLGLTLSPLLPPQSWRAGRRPGARELVVCSPPASCTHTRTRPHAWASVQSPPPRWACLAWQSGVEAARGPQASRRLGGSASVSLAASVNRRRRKSALLPTPARPASAPAGPSPSVSCVVNTQAGSPHPQGGGSIEEIELKAHNWKLDRLADVNGARYTRCTKKKETIMQRPGEEGSCISGSLQPLPTRSSAHFPSPTPALRPRPRLGDAPRTQICPSAPFVLRTGVGTRLPKMLHAAMPAVPPEIAGKRFLHPFLIAADCNDIFRKMNT